MEYSFNIKGVNYKIDNPIIYLNNIIFAVNLLL